MSEVKEFADTLRQRIIADWGYDPMYYASSSDTVEKALAKRDCEILDLIAEIEKEFEEEK